MVPCKITMSEGTVGKLQIVPGAKIKPSVTIDLSADVIIGPFAEVREEVMIFTHNHKWGHSRGLRQNIERIERVPLTIGRDAFIGARAILIGVSRIGEGAVIGAGAVVTKDVPDYEIWAGNPSTKIGERRDDSEEYFAS